jgi:hypothetical protein
LKIKQWVAGFDLDHRILYFYFCKVAEKNERISAMNFARNYEKKVHGTLEAWSMRRSSQHITLKIVGFQHPSSVYSTWDV